MTFDETKPHYEGERVNVRIGQEGFVGRVRNDALDRITVVFSKSGNSFPSLDRLTMAPFHALLVNWITFRWNFDIDV